MNVDKMRAIVLSQVKTTFFIIRPPSLDWEMGFGFYLMV